MIRSLAAAAMLAFGIARPSSGQATKAATGPTRLSVTRISWIGGCWQRRSANGAVIDEQWMTPRGGSMLGMSRTLRRDTTMTEYEHLRISERGAALVYFAEPSGQAPAEFIAKEASDTVVTFQNPTHDFPQPVIYLKRGADSLLARIEGTINAKARAVDFPYARIRCP